MNRSILHVDGDAFFVGCELAHRPNLRGKPVVVGEDKGIACAMSYEAKALGITRAMPIFKIRKLCPQVIILPNNFRLYRLYSGRMVSIVRRFTSIVEAYSIDECFADLTGQDKVLGIPYEQIALNIKEALHAELGMTFSVGLSVNKVLAKVASKWQKPNGLKVIQKEDIFSCLLKVPIAKVWGIGRSTTQYCIGLGIHSAGDLFNKTEGYIAAHFSKPLLELWRELRGELVLAVHAGPHNTQKSFMSTSTFRPPVSDMSYLLRELSKHAEKVCRHARRDGVFARRASFFIKKQAMQVHRYHSVEIIFDYPVAVGESVVSEIRKRFSGIFEENELYRATGVTLFDVVPQAMLYEDLFSMNTHGTRMNNIESYIDTNIRSRYGSDSVQIGSSVKKKSGKSSYVRNSRSGIFILRKIS